MPEFSATGRDAFRYSYLVIFVAAALALSGCDNYAHYKSNGVTANGWGQTARSQRPLANLEITFAATDNLSGLNPSRIEIKFSDTDWINLGNASLESLKTDGFTIEPSRHESQCDDATSCVIASRYKLWLQFDGTKIRSLSTCLPQKDVGYAIGEERVWIRVSGTTTAYRLPLSKQHLDFLCGRNGEFFTKVVM